jgi:hypothetical protein
MYSAMDGAGVRGPWRGQGQERLVKAGIPLCVQHILSTEETGNIRLEAAGRVR